PPKDGKPGLNRGVSFAGYNRNKYGAALDLSTAKGMEVVKRFIAWADVFAESFPLDVVKKWGLTYEEVVKINPSIIMVASNMQGQEGPAASLPGFGVQLSGLAGFANLTGWPDRPPITFVAYTDNIVAISSAAAIVAALDYRHRTGKGQFLDISQLEASLHFLAPMFLDYSANGRIATRIGNRCDHAAPHGIFRCLGDDRWCAIAVFTDEEWRSLCRAMGEPEWAKSKTFDTLLGRKANEDELENFIKEWTQNLPPEDVMRILQASGVAAGAVRNNEELFLCPQLKSRGYFWSMNHPEIGEFKCEAPPFKMSKTPAQPQRPGPCLGEHSELVYTSFLGMSDEEFIGLLQDGVVK
ncbi:MAG: CoA transferase, partial [Dehalococcoidia bacterium]